MLGRIIKYLDRCEKWLVLAHVKPDGDTLGCAYAIAHAGARMSKRVVLGCPDPYPARYEFLFDGLNCEVFSAMPEDFPGDGGAVVCVDTSAEERAVKGLAEAGKKTAIINIDHHPDNTMFGTFNWIDPEASATAEMVTKLLSASPWGVSPEEARALYVALVSDNGYFSFASTTRHSHDCANFLIASGASPALISEELDANLSAGVLRLWGIALSRAETFADGRVATFWLTREDFEATGTCRQDTENLVNFLLRVKGVRMAALCSELAEEDRDAAAARASVRARAPFNAREVAASFGGGGHNLAAACTIQLPIEQAILKLREAMENHVRSSCPR
jgi:phosphoesterase RecJ-like protein